MDAASNTYLYIIFSGTMCKMGSFIRFFTRGMYNHVSFSLSADLREMYSFARLKRDIPFCGGFVHEGAERYISGGKAAKIAVCAIDIGEEGMLRVRERIARMSEHPDRFFYNMLSAILVPCKKSVRVPNSFTCVEFVRAVLNLADFHTAEGYSAMELYRQLDRYEVYKGEFPCDAPVIDADYARHITHSKRFLLSVRQLSRLLKKN